MGIAGFRRHKPRSYCTYSNQLKADPYSVGQGVRIAGSQGDRRGQKTTVRSNRYEDRGRDAKDCVAPLDGVGDHAAA